MFRRLIGLSSGDPQMSITPFLAFKILLKWKIIMRITLPAGEAPPQGLSVLGLVTVMLVHVNRNVICVSCQVNVCGGVSRQDVYILESAWGSTLHSSLRNSCLELFGECIFAKKMNVYFDDEDNFFKEFCDRRKEGDCFIWLSVVRVYIGFRDWDNFNFFPYLWDDVSI